MHSSHFHSSRLSSLAACLLCLVVLFAGGCCCFTTLYDTSVYATWDKLEHGLNENSPAPVKLQGAEQTMEEQTGVTLRLPTAFDAKSMGPPLMRNAAEAGEAVKAERIQPPDLDLPGYYLTYEMFYPAEAQKKLPVYCYLGAVPKDQSLGEVKQAISKQLESKFPDAEWTSKVLPDTAESVDFLSVSGPQQFYPKEQKQPVEVPGRMDIYLVPKEHANVVVAWRGPTDIAKRLSLFEAAEPSVASVKSVEPAQPITDKPPSETPGGEQPTGQHAPFPNADVEIIPPVGFHKVARINGFQKEGSTAQITILPQQNPYDTLVAGYTDAYFKNNNLKVISREEITAGGGPAVMWLIELPGGQQYWLYVFGDAQQSFILTGILADPADEATKTAVRNAMLTARKKS